MKTALRCFRVILLVVQAVAGIILVFSLIKTRILNIKWVALIVAGLVLLLLLCAGGLFLAHRSERKRGKAKVGIVILRIVCDILAICSAVGCIFAFQYTNSLNSFLDKVADSIIETATDSDKIDFNKPFIIYISGSDSHTSVDDPDARSDVNILVVMNQKEGKILLASIPRDTYVQLHGTEGLKDKLTHAGLESLYDSDMSKLTIEDFLGIKIDRTVKVSFDTVVDVVDELDGIEIFSDTALTLKSGRANKTCDILYGKQTIDGECALVFSRERKSYYLGDRHRGMNQEEVLTGIINKLSSSRDYVLKIPAILEIASDSFTTTFSRDEITTLIQKQLDEGTNWQVESIWLNGEGQLLPTYTYPDMELYVMIPDEASMTDMKEKINEYLEEK